MKQYFVYIIQCIDGSFYIGITTDLMRRIKEHNGIISGGAKYTRQKGPVALRYVEEKLSRSEALKREYALKKYSRKEKEALCNRFSCLFQPTTDLID